MSGLMAVAIGTLFPSVRDLLLTIASAGYIGAFLAGILYGTAFTSSTATIILFELTKDNNPVLAAIIAGLGCALYDFSVFAIFRQQESRGMFTMIRQKFYHQVSLPPWLANTLGILIIASPLPDELSASLMSLTTLKAWQFAIISWLANIAGILVIISLGR
ncbi:MAG: hypothetical protein WCT27_03410 [Patescibacteria group bacterium]|jgi:hypothetical protein